MKKIKELDDAFWLGLYFLVAIVSSIVLIPFWCIHYNEGLSGWPQITMISIFGSPFYLAILYMPYLLISEGIKHLREKK